MLERAGERSSSACGARDGEEVEEEDDEEDEEDEEDGGGGRPGVDPPL